MANRKRSSAKPAVPARSAPTPRGLAGAVVGHKPMIDARAGLGHALNIEPLRYARELVRDVPDFPKPGILFKDVTPLLADPKAFGFVIDALGGRFVGEHLDAVVAVESRGFIFGAALARHLNVSFVPVRKPGKLPAETDSVSYSLEYGSATLQLHRDGLKEDARVIVVDDLLATGGTASAAGELVRRRGAVLLAYVFVIELVGLSGRQALEPTPVLSLIAYE